MNQFVSAGSSTDTVAPHLRSFKKLEGDLHSWLSVKMPAARGLQLSNFSYPKGAGLSHETILFDAAWTEGGAARSRGLVLRIKPLDHTVYQDDMFIEQFHVMDVIQRQGQVPIAAPLWLEEDVGLVGAPFFVMEKVNGRVPVNFPPYSREGWLADLSPEERRKIWRNGVTALARIQHLPLSEVSFLDPEGRFPNGFDQEWDRWRRHAAWAKAGRSFPFLERIWGLLEQSRPASSPPGLVWGDARIGNVMFGADGSVVAVMDWEQPSLGGALHDLAWWLFTARLETAQQDLPVLEGMGNREQTIALWQEVSGIEAQHIEWYEQFAAYKLACLSIRMLELRGMDGPGMNVVDNPPTRALAQMFGIPGPVPGELQ